MKVCAVCNVHFNDGVQCGTCRKELDFGCASISEAGWRRLGVDRRAQWKCPSCRLASPSMSTLSPEPSASLDTILKEIRDMKLQLVGLPTLVEDIRLIKGEIAELKLSFDQSNAKFDELNLRVGDLEKKALNFEKIQESLVSLQADLASTKTELASHEQRSRLNNIEIKGVPEKKNENLFNIIDSIGRKIKYNCPKTQINYISRVPMHNTKEKLIIVSFLNRYVKEDFIAAARADKDLSAMDLGFQDNCHRVYVNDHLSSGSKKLLSKAKNLAKEKNYDFIWVKHGKIHIRKNENSKVFIIRNEIDLNKII